MPKSKDTPEKVKELHQFQVDDVQNLNAEISAFKKEPRNTEYQVTDNSPIGFGKLKSKSHLVLKNPEWKSYCQWIIKQGSEFRYNSTRDYILAFQSQPQ